MVQNNKFWNEHRHEGLSKNEAKVYQMIDTLKHLPLFKKYANTLEFITDGHKKFGMIEIGPWFKWVSGNQLEKIRTRFDIPGFFALNTRIINAFSILFTTESHGF